jgi:hypothetical protein
LHFCEIEKESSWFLSTAGISCEQVYPVIPVPVHRFPLTISFAPLSQAASDYRWSSIIEGIVDSPPFQMSIVRNVLSETGSVKGTRAQAVPAKESSK